MLICGCMLSACPKCYPGLSGKEKDLGSWVFFRFQVGGLQLDCVFPCICSCVPGDRCVLL